VKRPRYEWRAQKTRWRVPPAEVDVRQEQLERAANELLRELPVADTELVRGKPRRHTGSKRPRAR
jgi:hypothetical protein